MPNVLHKEPSVRTAADKGDVIKPRPTELTGCTITQPQNTGIDGQMNQLGMGADLQLALE